MAAENFDNIPDKLGKKPQHKPQFLLVDNEESVVQVWKDTLATRPVLSEYADFHLFLFLEPGQSTSIGGVANGNTGDLVALVKKRLVEGPAFNGFFVDGNLGGGAVGLNGFEIIEHLRKEIEPIRFSPFALVTVSVENSEFRRQAADSDLVRYMPKFGDSDSALLPRMILEFEEMRAQARQAAWVALNQEVAQLLEGGATAEDAGKMAKEFLELHMAIGSLYFRDGEAGNLSAYVMEDYFEGGPDVKLKDEPPFYRNFASRASSFGTNPWARFDSLNQDEVGLSWTPKMEGWRGLLARTGDPTDSGGVYSIYAPSSEPPFREFEGPSLHHLAVQLNNRRARARERERVRKRQRHLTELLVAFTRPKASKDVGEPLARFLYEEFGQRVGTRAKATVRRFERGSGNLIRIGGPTGDLEATQSLIRISVNDPRSTYARVAKNMEPILYSNVVDHKDEFLFTNLDVKSSLTIPLSFEGVCYGAANLESDRLDAFSGEDQELAGRLGEAAAAAIARHRSLRFLGDASEFLDAIAVSPEGADATTLLSRSAEILYQFCGFSDLIIVLPPHEEGEPWSVAQVFRADYEQDRLSAVDDDLLQKWRDWVRGVWQNTHLRRVLAQRGELFFTNDPNEIDEDQYMRPKRPTLAQATLKVGASGVDPPEAMLALLFEHRHPLSERQKERLRAFGQFMGRVFLTQRHAQTLMNERSINSQEIWVGRVNSMTRHHFTNGLWTISGWLDAIKKGDATASEGLEQIELMVKKLAPLSERNRNLVKAVLIQPVCAKALWSKQCEEMSVAANLAKVTITAAPADLPVLLADADFLSDIFFALIENTIRYAGAGATITIAASEGGVIVADNGIGIRKDIKARLFAPGTTSDPISTGLGLYIARLMAQAMEGDLVHLDGNTGTAFEICLKRTI
jgi:signal transduction histidine kinase